MTEFDFYQGKTVLVTGHTGFKGAWLCRVLATAGAHVVGYALKPPTDPNLFTEASIDNTMVSIIGDIRNQDKLLDSMRENSPEVVFHLAAQPIVLAGYEDPRYTFETNVMGTVNLLEAVRRTPSVRSVVNVTTDKVYLNHEREDYAYREDDPLDGRDPYSSSKSCSDLLTHSYAESFLASAGVAVSTVRAGNVLGGGDFAPNRIIPDCIRSVQTRTPLVVRNPSSIRPYQHVLEPLFAYMLIAARQYENMELAGAYNVGPESRDCAMTQEVVELFSKAWGEGFSWIDASANQKGAHREASYLKLDSSKISNTFGWRPHWHIGEAVEAVVQWSKEWLSGNDVGACMDCQIRAYLEEW